MTMNIVTTCQFMTHGYLKITIIIRFGSLKKKLGTCKVRNKIKTEEKPNKTKQNQTKINNKSKRNKQKQ